MEGIFSRNHKDDVLLPIRLRYQQWSVMGKQSFHLSEMLRVNDMTKYSIHLFGTHVSAEIVCVLISLSVDYDGSAW